MSGSRGQTADLCYKIHLKIDGYSLLCDALVAEFNNACDRVEEAGENSVMLINVCGKSSPDVDRVWPGPLSGLEIQLVNQWEQALRRVERLAAVTIAAVQGTCAGVALEVLLATDYRLATPDLRICLSGPSGVWPSMSIFRFAHQLGIGRSRQVALFGADLSAMRTIDLGLVDGVVADLNAAVSHFIESLTQGIYTDIALRRRLLLDAIGTTFEDALGVHLAACDRMKRKNASI
jgi:isomerase DpgB